MPKCGISQLSKTKMVNIFERGDCKKTKVYVKWNESGKPYIKIVEC